MVTDTLSCGQVGFTLSIFNEASQLTYQNPPGYLIPVCLWALRDGRPLAAALPVGLKDTRCLSEGTSHPSSPLSLMEMGYVCREGGLVNRQKNLWVLCSFVTGSRLVLLKPIRSLSPFCHQYICFFSSDAPVIPEFFSSIPSSKVCVGMTTPGSKHSPPTLYCHSCCLWAVPCLSAAMPVGIVTVSPVCQANVPVPAAPCHVNKTWLCSCCSCFFRVRREHHLPEQSCYDGYRTPCWQLWH